MIASLDFAAAAMLQLMSLCCCWAIHPKATAQSDRSFRITAGVVAAVCQWAVIRLASGVPS